MAAGPLQNSLANAQAALRNMASTAETVREFYQTLFADAVAAEGILDVDGLIGPASQTWRNTVAQNFPAFLNAQMLAILGMFAPTVNIARGEMTLADLFNYMVTNSLEVKSRGTIVSAPTNAGGNVGNQVLATCSTDRNAKVIESAMVGTIRFACTAPASSQSTLGQDTYRYVMENAGVSIFQDTGPGVQQGTVQAVCAANSGQLVVNNSWDQAFNGTGVDKIPGWTVISGETNIAYNTTIYTQNRGTTPASLALSGNCVLRYYFRANGIALSDAVPFLVGLFWRTAGAAAGTLRVSLGSAGVNHLTVTVATTTSTTFARLMCDSNSANAWRRVFDTDGNPYIEVSLSSHPGGGAIAYIDDLFFNQLGYIGGMFRSMVSGLTGPKVGDESSQVVALTVNTAGDFELQVFASGDIVLEVNVGNGPTVNILPYSVEFDTDIDTTIGLIVDAINSPQSRTSPAYRAVADLLNDKVLIYQIFPEEGNVAVSVVASGGPTIVATDLSGASLGEIQNALVMASQSINNGVGSGSPAYLPHAASASTGWED